MKKLSSFFFLPALAFFFPSAAREGLSGQQNPRLFEDSALDLSLFRPSRTAGWPLQIAPGEGSGGSRARRYGDLRA